MEYSRIRENFEKHGFSTQLFSRKEDATAYLAGILVAKSIGLGGSVTLHELGLYEALAKTNTVVWHDKIAGMETRRMANAARVYITSANAVTETGEIVNIDGTGNRIAMTVFGPEICYFVVGRNKIVATVTEALHRCRNVAAPRNALRLKVKTPCAKNGDRCYNCNSPERICCVTVIHDRVTRSMRSEVIFVDQDLGY